MDRRGGRCGSRDRGQTAIDFLAGMTIFLITIGFVLNFVPGMFQPFETDTGSDMVGADRGAAILAESALVEDVDTPGALNESCTTEFFDADSDVGDCNYDADAADLNDAIGIDDTAELNVTIENASGVIDVDAGGGPLPAAAGRAPPPTADIVVGERVVLIDDEQATLYVRVW